MMLGPVQDQVEPRSHAAAAAASKLTTDHGSSLAVNTCEVMVPVAGRPGPCEGCKAVTA